MKLLLNQHLSRKLVPRLESSFPGTSHVALRGLETANDDGIWAFARDNGYVIATKDEDYQVLSFTRGHPPKDIWLRSGYGPSEQVLEILLRSRSIIEHFGDDRDRSLLVLP